MVNKLRKVPKKSFMQWHKLNSKTYIRAFKWLSERIKEKGVITFASNSSCFDGRAMDGLRKEREICWNSEGAILF